MNIHFKMPQALLAAVREDLQRPHAYAMERVGFLACRFGTSDRNLLILGCEYHPVTDEDYEEDSSVGARFSSGAIRCALEVGLSAAVGMFHVHMHEHRGVPGPSNVDWREWAKFVPNFWHVQPRLPHGALVLSLDRMSGWCWFPGRSQPLAISRFSVVGRSLVSWEVG